jgi:putative hydrolase of the HAD superfamily
MTKYKAVFFDLDGTLRSNQPEGFQAFLEYAGRVGIPLTDVQIEICERAVHRYWADGAQVFDHLSRYDERGFWVNYNQILLVEMGVHGLVPDAASHIQDHFAHYAPQDMVFADTSDVLRALKQSGFVLGLVSNRDTELDTLTTHYGFRHYFDFTLSGGQARSFKPDPGIFMRALAMAGDLEPADVVYVGDNYYADVVGARNVGMDAILIDPRDIFRDMYDKRVNTLMQALGVIMSRPQAG